jgi:hypothetical protein
VPRLIDSHRFTKDKRRGCSVACIDEQRQTPPDKIQRMLDLQLKIADQLKTIGQSLGIKPSLQTIKQQRPERIIAATWIAAGKNNDRCLHRFRRHC